MPVELWAHAKLRHRDESGILCDIFVYDQVGQRVADALGFRAAQVERKRGTDDVENGMYECRWEESPLADTSTAPEMEGAANGFHLVFADDRGISAPLIDRLESRGEATIRLRPGQAFHRLSAREFIIPPDSADGLRREPDSV